MCCTNRGREGWVTALLLLGVICSLGVAIPMLLITYPGDECLLFTSVRGEALIYGHHAGCIYVTVSHFLMVVASLFFFVMFFWSRAQGSRQDGTASNRSLRGSVAGLSQTIVRTKITLSILVLSIILTIFVFLTAIIILSGYIVTCGELQYETRRQLYGRTTLGSPVKDVYITCWSLFRDADFHNRFHFDHYELAGQWHGQYTTYKHGRPNTWSGKHNHHIPIAVGMELSLACSWLSVVIWVAITSLLSLLRKHVKALNRKEIAESIEDARIWAADMASVGGGGGGTSLHQYEMVNKNKHYDTIRSVRSQSRMSGAPSAITQQTQLPHASTLMEHQEVIAKTHEDGTYFMTSDGNYVQLVNGVLTNVSVTPMMQGAVQYSELVFQPQDSSELNTKLNQIHNQQQQVVYQQIQHPNQLNPQHLHQQQLQQQQLQQQRLQEQQQQHHQYQLQQQIQIQQQQQQQQQLQHQQLQQQRLKEQQEQQQLQQQKQIHLQQLQMQRQLEEQEALEQQLLLEQQQHLEQQKQKQEEEELKKQHQQRIRHEQMEQEKQLQMKQKQQQQFQRQLNEQLSQRSKQRPRSQLTVPLLSGSPSTTRRSVVSNNQSHVSNHQSHVSSTSGRKSPGASTNSRRSQISNGQTAADGDGKVNTRMEMRIQHDLANSAGIKCSQF
ncbi:uncharacterized protein LOC111718159 isoform X1 [Eurytemora carolleeae]|uniref:uncharacterized protein LOC111718159 isoform X1 n=1 Tax=Eurytemora carolleeae TaxID=1294199 RepID=UPI000C7893AF|nr:uncharacterized protein LOC111718159 isoform X1 [Eurytemora carolleeae]|eukprot:XP_023349442.1 uncharacterized protein LOC111718159 isoform X1 [Eurytemora affinis]